MENQKNIDQECLDNVRQMLTLVSGRYLQLKDEYTKLKNENTKLKDENTKLKDSDDNILNKYMHLTDCILKQQELIKKQLLG